MKILPNRLGSAKLLLLPLLVISELEMHADLRQAIRSGDIQSLRLQIASGANPNEKDAAGLTPLMYAAAYGSVEQMQLLLSAGADVNARSPLDSTALMFAAHNLDKTKLLLKAGADAKAVARNGVNALLAAVFVENTNTLRVLWDAGSNPQAEVKLIPTLPFRFSLNRFAYATNANTLRDFLRQAGSPLPDPEQLKSMPRQTPLSNMFLLSGFSFHTSSKPGFSDALSALLSLGASAKGEEHQLQRRSSPLSLVAMYGDLASAKLLLDAGADPNFAGSNGLTPLMAAVASEEPNLELAKLLHARGANLKAKDALGQTVLDWALKLGESPLSVWLREQGAKTSESGVSRSLPLGRPETPRQALLAALKPLGQAGPGFHAKATCISCHHQSLPSIALHIAASKGLTVDTESLSHATTATLRSWEPSGEDFLMGNCSIPGFMGNVAYGLFSMAEAGDPPSPASDASTICLASLQWTDGRWEGGDMRPPLAGKLPLVYTALAIRALATYAPPATRELSQRQIRQAMDFLLSAPRSDNQSEAFRLMGLVWGSASTSQIDNQARRLISLQGKEGAWAQRLGMKPDAYATGQALFALRKSGLRSSHPAFQKGIAFLLRTQLADGTWFVASRAQGFQPYLDAGFPHGQDQFISAAATAWAAAALGLGL